MIHALLYFFPLLINVVAGGTFFITAYRLAAAGCSEMTVGLTMVVWAAVYALVSLVVGKFTTAIRAPRLIIWGALLLALDAAGFLFFPGLYWQFAWLAGHGIAFAFYCTPFQVFTKAWESGYSGGVVRSTAFYTASWSFGMALGPFIFGVLSPNQGFLLNILIALICAGGVAGLTHWKAPEVAPKISVPDSSLGKDYSTKPDLVKLGWLIGGVGTMAVVIVRTLVPDRAVELGFSRADAGLVLSVVSLVQALTALVLARSREWMYRAFPALAWGVVGTIALASLGLASRLGTFYVAAVLYGSYSGAIYFYLVFHSLVHPTKNAQYVAVNEAVVGAANILAPLLGGAAAAGTNFSGAPFVTMAGLVLLTMAGATWGFRRAQIQGNRS